MIDEIYQTIKSMLEEARGDRYPRLARLLGPVEPHIKVNYEGSDQVKAGDALAKEKARHDKITAALEWLEEEHFYMAEEAKNPIITSLPELGPEVSDATETRIEPSDNLGEHTGDAGLGAPAPSSGSGSIEQREEVKEI